VANKKWIHNMHDRGGGQSSYKVFSKDASGMMCGVRDNKFVLME